MELTGEVRCRLSFHNHIKFTGERGKKQKTKNKQTKYSFVIALVIVVVVILEVYSFFLAERYFVIDLTLSIYLNTYIFI